MKIKAQFEAVPARPVFSPNVVHAYNEGILEWESAFIPQLHDKIEYKGLVYSVYYRIYVSNTDSVEIRAERKKW